MEVAIKMVVVGNGAVGKSSMIQRYCKGIFTKDYKKTIGVDFLERQIQYVPSALSLGSDLKSVWALTGKRTAMPSSKWQQCVEQLTLRLCWVFLNEALPCPYWPWPCLTKDDPKLQSSCLSFSQVSVPLTPCLCFWDSPFVARAGLKLCWNSTLWCGTDWGYRASGSRAGIAMFIAHAGPGIG